MAVPWVILTGTDGRSFKLNADRFLTTFNRSGDEGCTVKYRTGASGLDFTRTDTVEVREDADTVLMRVTRALAQKTASVDQDGDGP